MQARYLCECRANTMDHPRHGQALETIGEIVGVPGWHGAAGDVGGAAGGLGVRGGLEALAKLD